jgi:glycosyltransferase involved in cell wall biosynthesis
VIPNIAHGMPLPAESDPYPALNAPRKDIDCLWVGTCNANKAPLDFLKVVRACPDARCAMIMAPGSDEALQREVSSQASSLANLDYRGFVPYREIGDFYRRSRLVVHTSHIEGFPNVFLQAWECGAPVVAVRVDPDGVIARHGLGRVSGSVAGAIADVRALLADESIRIAIGEACRDYLIRTHSPDAVIDQYLDYFAELGVKNIRSTVSKTGHS